MFPLLTNFEDNASQDATDDPSVTQPLPELPPLWLKKIQFEIQEWRRTRLEKIRRIQILMFSFSNMIPDERMQHWFWRPQPSIDHRSSTTCPIWTIQSSRLICFSWQFIGASSKELTKFCESKNILLINSYPLYCLVKVGKIGFGFDYLGMIVFEQLGC